MKYIVHRRFRHSTAYARFNIPAMTECEEVNGVITYQGREVCAIKSKNAHQFFARNDDGNGMIRGQLTQAIQNTLSKQDPDYQKRWDKVWDDLMCQPYRREEHDDHWVWNHEFYEADIEVLKYIASLIGVKGVS